MKAWLLTAFIALAAAAAPLQGASLAKFKGTYRGTFTASGSFAGESRSATGLGSLKITPTQKKHAATIHVSGTDPTSGRQYATTITLNKDGTATSTALVPGSDVEAAGTWKLSGNGKKITVKLKADVPIGSANGTATLQVNGDVLKLKSSGKVSSDFGSGTGRFDFTGRK
jgi:hypothetical protein